MTFRRSASAIVADVGGELVLMDGDHREFFAFDGVGVRVWEMLEEPQSIEAIARVVACEYAVDENVCRTDVESFVHELHSLGVVDKL